MFGQIPTRCFADARARRGVPWRLQLAILGSFLHETGRKRYPVPLRPLAAEIGAIGGYRSYGQVLSGQSVLPDSFSYVSITTSMTYLVNKGMFMRRALGANVLFLA